VVQIICVTYNQREELKCLINSIKSQTVNSWFLRIIHDGNCHKYKTLKKELNEENYLSEKVTIECTEERYNDWGHSLRDYALQNQNKKSDWTLITNGDNYYLPTLIETILAYSKEKPKAELLYWDLIQRFDKEIHKTPRTTYQQLISQLKVGHIDIGAVAVKTKIASKVGFKSRRFEADWDYIKDCLEEIGVNQASQLKKDWQVYNKIVQGGHDDPPIEFLRNMNLEFRSKAIKINEMLFAHI